MGDEPNATASLEESPLPPTGSDEKPKRRPRRTSEAKSPPSLPTTEAGEKTAEQLRQKLIEMVDAAALTEANRRRATAIDTTDCEAGFDRIAGPKKQETAIAIVADIANTLGSGLIGYSINVYTGSGSDYLKGHISLLSGAAFVVMSILLKYVLRKK